MPAWFPTRSWQGSIPRNSWHVARGAGTGKVVRLAEQNGSIVGFSASGKQPDASLPYSGEILALYVLRRAQRLGIGRALMATSAGDLLSRGHVSAMLWVLEANTPARCFYASLGGREVPEGNSSATDSASSASPMRGTT